MKKGDNHCLGSLFIYVTNLGPSATSNSYLGDDKLSDEGGKAVKGKLIYFIKNDNQGLTQVGMKRLNQSTEAFVNCILVSQVDVKSSILGSPGSAKEAQREFLVLVEHAIRKPEISKRVQRFELAIDDS